MTTVGFIGLGAMGLPMARNLVQRQFRVRGFDLKREALDSLVDAGGMAAGSAAEAAAGADVLVLMVVNAAQAESVLFDAGALAAMVRPARSRRWRLVSRRPGARWWMRRSPAASAGRPGARSPSWSAGRPPWWKG
jgi:hypothetical protein